MTRLQKKLVKIIFLIPVLSLLSGGSAVGSDVYKTSRTTIRIISEVKHINPGKPFWIGIYFNLEPDWHIYWKNPGDAGLAPDFTWQLPEDLSVVDIRWPYPETIMLGGLANFGYTEAVLIPVKIMPSQTITLNRMVSIGVQAEWLVCKEECIPESAELVLQLPVKNSPAMSDERWQDIFNRTREKLPLSDIGWDITATYDDTYLTLRLMPPDWFDGQHQSLRLYPEETEIIENAGIQKMELVDGRYKLTIPRNLQVNIIPDTISGVLVSKTGWRGTDTEKALYFKSPVSETRHAKDMGILLAIIFAFSGGIILNLMPCVLPVLSLKLLGFVNQAGEDRRRLFYHGVVFTAGVLVSFLLLAGFLIILQTGGEQLGWGFQLQSPGFIYILSLFLFLFALNLFGVFEMGTSIMGVGQGVSAKGGWFGSFMTGVTATIVATPCTAPFMGSALGFAITQPAAVSMVIFASLGLGMAAPYLLISALPGLLKFIPKPGPWMETMKQFMGFLLVGTVIWLVWVFSLQTGSNGVLLMLTGLLVSAICAWMVGRWGQLNKPASTRRKTWIFSLILISLTIVLGIRYLPDLPQKSSGYTSITDGLAWIPYSEETYRRLRKNAEPFLIDFTAAWCLSCQVNEQVAFGSSEVRQKISESGITLLKADWTSKDPVITRALEKYGRNSVPLYVVYGTVNEEPVILPEILTPGIVLDVLKKLE